MYKRQLINGLTVGHGGNNVASNTAVGDSALYNNTVGQYNTANGYQALNSNTDGSKNTALGYQALEDNTIGSNNTAIGYNAQVPSAVGDNQVRIGNVSVTYAGVQVPWTYTSDKRWKSDIQSSELGLNFISKLRPVQYYRTNDEGKKTEYGFIAQELEEALNNAGATNNGIISKDDAGMYGVRYNDLISPMVKATQELNSKVASQQQTIEAQQAENEALRSRLDKLEQLIKKLAK